MEFQEGDAHTSSAKSRTNPLAPVLNDNSHSSEHPHNEVESELAQASCTAPPSTAVASSDENLRSVSSEQSPEQVKPSSTRSIDLVRRNANTCHRTAMYPKYASEDARRATMTNFPREKFQDVESLVAAGFFYDGYMDRVICFSCGGALFHWDEHDDPLIEHVRWYPDCAYVLLCLGPQENAEISKRQQDVLETVISNTLRVPIAGIEKSHIEESLKEITRISKNDQTSPSVQNPCAVCLDDEKSVLFLPCQHLVACVNCASAVDTCPMCRTPIKSAIRAFFC
ncbi:apoptosis inhibitor IAP, putative [Ixodes scapularis]|uniref:Apoptosis inhibitor IAP, putative n=1 Tax=Ixodes scapularis TaxID=6945 RepID=B7QP11_IXOSC|nr:apoptosis inhibitor IAP, putative [Ixodes scapularis]|eukprot:XP_002416666.1 apoptosis inhibitor IAP, putative [Ixodes scapularis]